MDLFLRILLVGLLFFAPFSFAAAEPWAFSVLQGGLAILLLGTLFPRRELVITPLFKPICYTLGFLTFYALLQCISPQTLLMQPAPYPSTFMRLYTLEHASYFVTYLTLVFCAMQLTNSSKKADRLVVWIAICSAATSLCALSLSKGEYIYWFTGVRRGFGPFLNRNHGGIFLATAAILLIGWVCAAFSKRKFLQRTEEKQVFLSKQLWGLLIAVTVGIAAVFSRSRGGMLSLTIGLLTVCILCTLYIPMRWKKRGLCLLLILSLFGAGAYWAATHTVQINRFAHRNTSQDVSIQTRKMMYRAANNILHDYPVWGVGIGAMPIVITSYTEYFVDSYIERLHSDWLEMLISIGYIGSLFTLAGLIWFAWLVLKRLRRLETIKKIKLVACTGALMVMCAGALADFPFFIPANAFLFFLIMGIACSPVFWKHHVHTLHLGQAGRALLIFVFLSACLIPLQKTLAWRLFLFGKNLKIETKISYYQQGLSHYPSPRFAVRLGNTYYKASLHAKDPQEKAHFRQQAHQIATLYLQRYPKDKQLSILYLRTRPSNPPLSR